MPVTTADVPNADKPEPKPKATPAKPGLAAAAASSDPAVQKLMWDRGHRGDDTAAADAELRKLGFDL